MTNKRNESIDIIKGFLILCVLIGHILLGSIKDNFARYAIYSFHMHVFMFVSGYMVNIDKLSQQSYKDICIKYWNRMLKMWTFAFIIFTCYQILDSRAFQLNLLLSPWYHLWYVPTFFGYILICRTVFTRVDKKTSYLFLPIMGIMYIVIKHFLHISIPRWCDCTYLPFFALGILLKNTKALPQPKCHLIFIPVFFAVVTATRYFNIQSYGIIEMLSLIPVIIFCIYPVIISDSLPSSSALSYMGKNSLEIYLWHVIPVILFKELLSNNTNIYYLCSFALLLAFIVYARFKGELIDKNI